MVERIPRRFAVKGSGAVQAVRTQWGKDKRQNGELLVKRFASNSPPSVWLLLPSDSTVTTTTGRVLRLTS